jgi:hypothetical protein
VPATGTLVTGIVVGAVDDTGGITMGVRVVVVVVGSEVVGDNAAVLGGRAASRGFFLLTPVALSTITPITTRTTATAAQNHHFLPIRSVADATSGSRPDDIWVLMPVAVLSLVPRSYNAALVGTAPRPAVATRDALDNGPTFLRPPPGSGSLQGHRGARGAISDMSPIPLDGI